MRPTRPDRWFLLLVLLVAAGGTALLHTRATKTLNERDWTAYGILNIWESAFDAVSATCGVGLLTCDIDQDYTPLGRWVLSGLGMVGALLYLVAGLQAVRRLRSACGERVPLPPIWLILVSFAVLLVLSVAGVTILERVVSAADGWPREDGRAGSAVRAIAAFASLGWLPGSPPRSVTWIYAVVALMGGVGWMVWLLPLGPARRQYLCAPRVLGLLGSYVVFLLLMGALVFALEAPRTLRKPVREEAMLTGRPAGQRYARSLVQTVCAATAGMPTEDLADRNVTDGTKVTLAAVVLVGPLGGSAGGGFKWTLLIWGLSGGAAGLTRRGRSTHPATFRCLLAGTSCVVLLVLLTTVVALGLLVIETRTAAPYQSPPTFADAFLDAASATAGGNLSTGLADTVTSRNLSRGGRQAVDLYPYGMTWLMLAMLLGRVLPLWVLCRAAAVPLHSTPRGTPPLV